MNKLDLVNQAWQEFEVADHLLKVTYPLFKDPKLFRGIIINLAKSLDMAKQLTDVPIPLLNKLNWIISFQKKCPVEFPRLDTLVMYDNRFQLRKLTLAEVQKYHHQTLNWLKIYLNSSR
ncbi:MAG TPA: hypothetical protein VJC39_01900 [Candidatus Nanoarchaeia archaeon]|nr:hypothetical protein [Candidatus Nanoarchaeia archaeon]